jgi:ATP-binding cassette subfamily F protein uup
LLARVLKRGGNFLVLDEPTNDLDLQTMRILEEALTLFPGCVLVVSHDRYFLNRVCTGILAFEGEGQVTFSEGNYDYYLEKRRRAASGSGGAAREFKLSGSAPTPKAGKIRKLSFKEQRELEGIEAVIQSAEAQVTERESQFLDPEFVRKNGGRMQALLAELETAKAGVAKLYSRWEELEAVRAAAAQS